ncbi:hypothetical protein GALL_547940 [mine drainage metagenome]|uniref:Uncharacterized protein n=1 Tax=mine drainage metagenome TaxID=410659 RepID=A0A1J5NWR5_9ZZZZ
MGVAQGGQKLHGSRQHQRKGIPARAGPLRVKRITMRATDDAIATQRLAGIDTATLDTQAQVHEAADRFSHRHHRVLRHHRHRFTKVTGNAARPGTGAVEQKARTHLQTGTRNQHKLLAVMHQIVDAGLFANVGPELGRRTRKRGRHQARIGVTILRTERAPHRTLAQPRVLRAQCFGTEYLQIHAKPPAAFPVSFE